MKKTIDIKDIKNFDVTGVDRDGKRFSMTYGTLKQSMMINLWSGSVWARLNDGSRKLLKRV